MALPSPSPPSQASWRERWEGTVSGTVSTPLSAVFLLARERYLTPFPPVSPRVTQRLGYQLLDGSLRLESLRSYLTLRRPQPPYFLCFFSTALNVHFGTTSIADARARKGRRKALAHSLPCHQAGTSPATPEFHLSSHAFRRPLAARHGVNGNAFAFPKRLNTKVPSLSAGWRRTLALRLSRVSLG